MSHLKYKREAFWIFDYFVFIDKAIQKWSTDTFRVLIEPLTVSIDRAGVSEEGLQGFLPWMACSISHKTMISFSVGL